MGDTRWNVAGQIGGMQLGVVVEGEQTGASRENGRDVGFVALVQIAISYSASAGYIATSIDINPLTLQLLSRNLNLPH